MSLVPLTLPPPDAGLTLCWSGIQGIRVTGALESRPGAQWAPTGKDPWAARSPQWQGLWPPGPGVYFTQSQVVHP